MSDGATYTFRPPVRCFGPSESSSIRICAKSASWQRPGRDGELPQFFCDDCRQPGDQPLTRDAFFRRIQVVAEIQFTGAASDRTIAQAEAIARLDQALADVGAVLSLHTVTSTIGRTASQAPQRAAIGKRGRG